MPQHSNLTLCYEAIQRIYRNAVVSHIRRRMTSSYPQEFSEKLAKPLQKEWAKMKESALERRHTGELLNEIADDFDLLGVNHFFSIFEVHLDVLCDFTAGVTEEQKKKEKQALLQWMKSIKNLRDPLSHPSNEDFTFEDSFVLMDCARRVLLRFGLNAEGEQIKALTEQLSGRPLSMLPGIEPLEDRLPPRESIVVDFIGRKRELDALWEWFSDPLSRKWFLAGEGGKGKSAIAYTFGTEVKFKAPSPFQIVLWLSAKKKAFQSGRTVPIAEPDFCNLDSALNCLLEEYGWANEIEAPPEGKRERVLELLDTFPALIIVDDIDSLEGDAEDAIEFFSDFVPKTKSKVLFTSRRTHFGMGNRTTHIGGLETNDAHSFIQSRCKLMELDLDLLPEKSIREIIRVTEASPLYIEDLLRLVSVVPAHEAVRLWREKGGDEARQYALGREQDMLSADARKVLVAACVAGRAVSMPEMEATTALSTERLAAALAELQRLFLVAKPHLIEGEQRFEVNINTRALVIKVEASSDLFRRIESAYKAVSGKVPDVGRGEIGAIIRQAVFHVRNHAQPKAEELLIKALEKYGENRDLLAFLGWVYRTWDPPRVNDARERFKRAHQLKYPGEEMYRHWSQMEINEREWSRAARAAEYGLKLIATSRLLLYLAGYSRSRLGKELLGGLHRERAKEELMLAKDSLERALMPPELLDLDARNLNADIFRALVLNSELLQDPPLLHSYLKRWQEEHPDDPNLQSERSRLTKLGLLKVQTE
jgi:hypothetical protein